MKNPDQQPRARFQPERHTDTLLPLLRELTGREGLPSEELQRLLRKAPKEGRGFFSRSDLIAGFRHFAKEVDFGLDEREFLRRVRRKPVRTQSGVTPVTVLTKPYPCPGECIFCPSDARMPKSYLRDEPGAQRAASNQFDPYLQTWNRLLAFYQLGHPVDKVELIVLGGTWSSYPEAYQRGFVKRCFEALNDFGAEAGFEVKTAEALSMDFRSPWEEDSAEGAPYNEVVTRHLRQNLEGRLLAPHEHASWEALEAAQRKNESSESRCVGLVLETRPDCVDEAEVFRLRRLGATKVQLGIQSLSDEVLEANGRGHDSHAARRALGLLRRAGFKLHAHWMPNLHGSTPEMDRADYERLFGDPGVRPDELKIYPCSLIASSALMREYEAGRWAPYAQDELVELLVHCLEQTPAYCRLTRIVRDIPSPDIVVGNKITNLREVAERELAVRGGQCRDIRSREIRATRFDPTALALEDEVYETAVSREHFLSFVTEEDRLLGFLRLSLPHDASFVEELGHSAIIREVHVYGAAASLGERDADKAQHLGLGRRLIERAGAIAAAAGYDRLAVISAVGTRAYYRKLGFEDGALYQHRTL